MDKFSPPLMNRDKYMENTANLASIYGEDVSTVRVALFSFELNYYYLGFSYCYGMMKIGKSASKSLHWKTLILKDRLKWQPWRNSRT